MTRLTAALLRWHAARTKRSNAKHRRPTTNFGHQCMTTRKAKP